MKSITAKVTKGLCHGSRIETCDNSGAKIVRIVSVKGSKTVRRKKPEAGVGDLVLVSVLEGEKDMRKKVFPAVIVRQKKEYRRPEGTRIQFEDNAVVMLKDEKGTPKGTIFKGPIAKEVSERWPGIARVASSAV